MKLHENQKEVTGDKNTHPKYFQKILTFCFHIHQNSAWRLSRVSSLTCN